MWAQVNNKKMAELKILIFLVEALYQPHYEVKNHDVLIRSEKKLAKSQLK